MEWTIPLTGYVGQVPRIRCFPRTTTSPYWFCVLAACTCAAKGELSRVGAWDLYTVKPGAGSAQARAARTVRVTHSLLAVPAFLSLEVGFPLLNTAPQMSWGLKCTVDDFWKWEQELGNSGLLALKLCPGHFSSSPIFSMCSLFSALRAVFLMIQVTHTQLGELRECAEVERGLRKAGMCLLKVRG